VDHPAIGNRCFKYGNQKWMSEIGTASSFRPRGFQYASNEFQALLKAHAIQCSMSRKGDCWDNAVAESFFHTLKVELIHGKIYDTRQEAKMDIFDYIEIFYNRKHRHSYLGYLSPVDFEKKNAA